MKTKYNINIIGFCVLLLVLSGCATISKNECKTATRDTWVSVGFDDGRHGRPENTIRAHQKACAGIISPNLGAYQEGHARGVAQYCVEGTGYATGIRGQSKNSVCASHQFPGYHKAYHVAKGIRSSELVIRRMTKELQQAMQARADAEYEIKVVEAELISPGLSIRQRKKLLERAKQLRNDLYNYDAPVAEIEERLRVTINAHNRNLLLSPYEQRPPLVFPTLIVQEKPVPRPHGHAQHERQHHGRETGKHRIMPDSFIIAKHLSRIKYSRPNALLNKQITYPVNKHDKKHLTKRDNSYLDKGYYHLFRFPNKSPMKIHWFGHTDGEGKNAGKVELFYWGGHRFITARIRSTKDKRGYVFDVELPVREKYLYVLVNGNKGRIYTDFITAIPVEVERDS